MEKSSKLQTGDVARAARVSPDAVRLWERTGKLKAERTPSGNRVFDRDDVDRFIAARQRSRK